MQTNDDHWTGVCTDRCSKANERIKAIGQAEMTPQRLRDEVLMLYPNANEHGIYNSLMIPSQKVDDVSFIVSDMPDPDVPKYHTSKRHYKTHYSHFLRWIISWFVESKQ